MLAGKSKAARAAKNGAMKDAIVSIVKKGKKGDVTVDTDEALKKSTTLDKLLALPSINCCGTATEGNIAPLADGAASIILLSADRAKELGCQVMARLIGFGIAAGHPQLIERTSVRSMEKALQFAGIGFKDVDFIDMHEPSAAFAVAVAGQLGPDAAGKLNVDGGSLAYGHAGAATGGAMVANMLYRLQRTGAKTGLVNVGALGGQSLSVLIQR